MLYQFETKPELQYFQEPTPNLEPTNIYIGRIAIPVALIEQAPDYTLEADKVTANWQEKALEYKLGYVNLDATTQRESIDSHNRAYQYSVVQVADDLKVEYDAKCYGEEGDSLRQSIVDNNIGIHIEGLKQWYKTVHAITLAEHALGPLAKTRVNVATWRLNIWPVMLEFAQAHYESITDAYVQELHTIESVPDNIRHLPTQQSLANAVNQ